MRVIRSFMFVPASRPTWIDRIPGLGADAVILDLEDSVPNEAKGDARRNAAGALAGLAASGQRIYVRINRTPHMYDFDDILAVVRPGLEGLMLPKPHGDEDMRVAAALVAEAESRGGVPAGSVVFAPVLETARSVVKAFQIAEHPRVAVVVAASAKNGDVARSLGFQWTAEGLETLHLRSSVIAAARAAGKLPVGGLWQDVHDVAGLDKWARFNRQLGFTGELVLHPSNIAPVNAAYTPSAEDVAYYTGMVEAFETAKSQGRAAVLYEGDHVDYAHVATAREMIALAQAINSTSR